jgi:hypothetical protein
MGSTLRQRTAEEVKEIRTNADKRVAQSYLQQVELTTMEQLGSCKFLMTMDRGERTSRTLRAGNVYAH